METRGCHRPPDGLGKDSKDAVQDDVSKTML